MLSMALKIWAGRKDNSAVMPSSSSRTSTFNRRDSPSLYVTDIPRGNIFGGGSVTAGAAVSEKGNTAAEQKPKSNAARLAPRSAVVLKGKSLTSSKMKRGYCSEKYADLVIRCGSAAFKVHKMILCSRCEFFERLCDGAWKESSQSIVELHDEEELVVEALLTFLYTWSYADFFVNGGGASAAALKTGDVVLAQALFNIKVYVAADKYGVVDLQQQAADAFGSALLRASSAAPSGARNGDSGSSLGRTSAKLTPAALTQIINEVYNGVATALPHDRVLRDIVCLVMSIEINALMREPSFVALFEDGGGSIAADAAKSLAQRVNPGQKKYRCPACGKHFEAEIPAREYLSFLCFHCRCSLSRDVWEDHVVLPDLAAVWRGRRGNAS